MRISKEVPIWVIDGNNKIFTTLNPIDSIDDLWIDGAIYVWYTFISNVITLSDAPTATIYLDYKTADTITPITSNTTLGRVKQRVWTQLGQKSTSTNFSNEIVDREINILANEIWRGKIVNPLTNRVHRAWELFWQEAMYSFRTNGGGTVTEPINVWDTTITMSTATLNPTGYLLLEGDIVKYSGKTATTITWVSGIQKTHKAWILAEQIYQMPLNYEIMIWVVKVEWNRETEIQYEVIRDWEVPLVRLTKEQRIIKTRYVTKYVHPSDDTEDFPLPDSYGESVVADIVAWRLAYPKGLPQAERLLQMWFNALSWMYMFYSKDKKDLNQKILPQTRKWRYSQ